jgi:hypothetical protein
MPERGSGLLIVAMKLLVMGVEPRGSVIRLMNVANPLCGDERQERLGNGSRMTRECHVRFCGEAQGEIPWAYSPTGNYTFHEAHYAPKWISACDQSVFPTL